MQPGVVRQNRRVDDANPAQTWPISARAPRAAVIRHSWAIPENVSRIALDGPKRTSPLAISLTVVSWDSLCRRFLARPSGIPACLQLRH